MAENPSSASEILKTIGGRKIEALSKATSIEDFGGAASELHGMILSLAWSKDITPEQQTQALEALRIICTQKMQSFLEYISHIHTLKTFEMLASDLVEKQLLDSAESNRILSRLKANIAEKQIVLLNRTVDEAISGPTVNYLTLLGVQTTLSDLEKIAPETDKKQILDAITQRLREYLSLFAVYTKGQHWGRERQEISSLSSLLGSDRVASLLQILQ